MELEYNISLPAQGYLRYLGEAICRTYGLFEPEVEALDDTRIHAVKSVLYVAIERAGMEAERSNSVQQMLRELLFLMNSRADPVWSEKQEALRILRELQNRFFPA